MEEEPVTKKIGWAYILIGIAYIVVLITFAFLAPLSESTHQSDACMMLGILQLVSIPIILSGLFILKKNEVGLIFISIVMAIYAAWWFPIMFQFDEGFFVIIYFISFSLVPAIMACFNFFIILRLFKTTPQRAPDGQVAGVKDASPEEPVD